MRVSEYSKTKSKQDHNFRHDLVQIYGDGLCVEFLSDKMLKNSEPPHHHLITWSDLPEGSMETFLQYKQLRPKNAPYFFTRKDGRPLERTHIMAFLDLCLIQTSYQMLWIVPHSLCQGGASDCHWNGQSIIKICHEGRWSEKSSLFESYSHPNLVAMPPEQIFNEIQRYHQNCPFKRLYHLSKNAVQTEGSCEDHPHAQALEKFFPDFMQSFGPVMPRYYPHPVALSKMRQEDADAKSEYYLKMWVAIEEAKKESTNADRISFSTTQRQK